MINDFKKQVDNVIVANKISEDKTEIIAKDNGAKVISGDFLGYGDAIRAGIKNSKADIIVLAEADGTFRSSDLKKLLDCLMDNDVVQGTRTNPAYIQYRANMDRSRIFWKTKYNKIEKNIISVNAAFAPELTIEFINKGFRVIEIPVNYYPRNMGVSKLSGTYVKSALTALKMLKIIIQKRFLYLFSR